VVEEPRFKASLFSILVKSEQDDMKADGVHQVDPERVHCVAKVLRIPHMIQEVTQMWSQQTSQMFY